MELTQNTFWQTKARGTNSDEYQIYLDCVTGATDVDTGEPEQILTFDEWMGN
jgi:hypothetical protein